jgi:isoamylase
MENKIQLEKGYPLPLGPSFKENGINFAFYAEHASGADLCLFSLENHALIETISLKPNENKSGNVWHILIKNLPLPLAYAYRIHGENIPPKKFAYDKQLFLIDPYAKEISSKYDWGENKPYRPLGMISQPSPFDWQGDTPPRIPLRDLIIYETHVRGFTQSPSSGITNRGTFLGFIEKIPHLVDLGINAIELLPLQEFNENENPRFNPETSEQLYNYWGYSTVNFFSLMNRYTSNREAGGGIREFKTLVRELHKHGIEVILDVVFNHTAEGNGEGPTFSFKGFENPVYYILNDDFSYANYSGCGNTFNCNHPITREFILECLRYWVLEMHIDGFRFDLASILTRGRQGQPLPDPPLIEVIAEDPVLSHTKLIAEPWDLSLYQVGQFYFQTNRWSEWNGKYRDCFRKYIKGTPGFKGEFITRLFGSEDLYHNRSPLASINFVTVHDGFSLRDLVSYDVKHNENNGEDNKDGINENDSWNCGIEGPSDNAEIEYLRNRQMKNFHFAQMISRGIPMLLMGDEYGHTKNGNNNTWCQDNELNWFLWDRLQANHEFYRFYKLMIKIRKEHALLREDIFLAASEVLWHGVEPLKPDWSTHTQFIAFTLLDPKNGQDLYIAFNAQKRIAHVHFPEPKKGKKWHILVDTAARSPYDIFEREKAPLLHHLKRDMKGFSALLLSY